MTSSTSTDDVQLRPAEGPFGKQMHHRSTCRLCDSPDVQLVISLTPTPPVDAFIKADKLSEPQPNYPLDLYLCKACGHSQLLDVVSPDILFGEYIYETSSSPGLVEHFRKYADDVVGAIRTKPGSLAVDVGSNDGTLLRFMKKHGFTVLGVDPAAEIGRRATASGIETRTAFFEPKVAEAIRRERGPATLITANNVFAHKDDLGEMTDGVSLLLADDGLFIFEVSYMLDMIEGMIFDLIYHEHLSYHTVKPLAAFLRRHGMELIDVARNKSKGGTIRCFAQRTGGPRQVTPVVAKMIEHEDAIGLDKPEIYRKWAKDIDQSGKDVDALVRKLRADGKKIAGYGAAATGTVLTYEWDLGDKLDFLVDDEPQRQGRFSPGHHIPVLSGEAIYERKPDYVIILAWRFADMIMAKHQRYLAQGGRFIVPLPTLRVIE